MTRIFAIAAVALTALAGAASANIPAYLTDAQIEQLSDAELLQIQQIVTSEDSAGDERAKVRAVLLDAGLL